MAQSSAAAVIDLEELRGRSVGILDAHDLVDDLAQALEGATR